MSNEIKNIQCGTCNHQEVCIFKSELLKAQIASNDIAVPSGDGTIRMLKDIPYIEHIKLKCIYYQPVQPTIK